MHYKSKLLLALLIGILVFIQPSFAVQIPPTGSTAYIQTSGPNTPLTIGDFYARNNEPHDLEIYIPCAWPGNEEILFSLFDPESYVGPPGNPVLDEPRGTLDNTLFRLYAPDNSLITSQSYPPVATTDNQWVGFAIITTNVTGCVSSGSYNA